MKKHLAALLILMLVLSSTACSGNAASGTSASSHDEGATSTKTLSSAESSEVTEALAEESGESAEESEEPTEESVELIVFAAASMTETLEEIQTMYKEVAPNVELTFNFDSSGTLTTQIQEGAECDIFISAGQKQMDQMDITADEEENTEGLDFVQQGTRIDLLENRVTLCIPEGNPSGIESFDDLPDKIQEDDFLFAMGNSDVPVGQYTQKILTYYDLDEETLAAEGKITYGTNVKEVTTQIAEASVSCGVVYCTDAFSAGLEIKDYATEEMCGQVIYPAAVLNISENQDEAGDFLAYLQTTEAMTVFENVGFVAA